MTTPTEHLAAVVLHALIRAGADGLDTEPLTRAVERDFDNDSERAEIRSALQLLAAEDLAIPDGGERWRPTRAALAAERLRF